jgi:hypothetical protein
MKRDPGGFRGAALIRKIGIALLPSVAMTPFSQSIAKWRSNEHARKNIKSSSIPPFNNGGLFPLFGKEGTGEIFNAHSMMNANQC